MGLKVFLLVSHCSNFIYHIYTHISFGTDTYSANKNIRSENPENLGGKSEKKVCLVGVSIKKKSR